MKPVIAAVAMLMLLTLALLGVKNESQCDQNKRAKASNLEWQDKTDRPTTTLTSPTT